MKPALFVLSGMLLILLSGAGCISGGPATAEQTADATAVWTALPTPVPTSLPLSERALLDDSWGQILASDTRFTGEYNALQFEDAPDASFEYLTGTLIPETIARYAAIRANLTAIEHPRHGNESLVLDAICAYHMRQLEGLRSLHAATLHAGSARTLSDYQAVDTEYARAQEEFIGGLHILESLGSIAYPDRYRDHIRDATKNTQDLIMILETIRAPA
jgi:hypothetical protein